MGDDVTSEPDTQSIDQDESHLKDNMRTVALTALAGTSIEWFDFFIYASAAALVFPSQFFPDADPTTALILSFGTFAFGFIARPIGGVVFAHFGDKVGRKRALVVALMLMGVASTLIGLLPTYAAIGVAAPILLSLLRFAQGLAIGGQWGGAMLLVTENAPDNQRGYYGAFAQAGAPVGVILANLAFIIISMLVSDEAFLSWGWRIPFISSILLIGISLFIQVHLEDGPAFKELEARKQTMQAEAGKPADVQRSPVLEALVKYPQTIMLAAGAFICIQVTYYILVGFMLAYGSDPNGAGLSRDGVLWAVLIASAIQIPAQFAAASYSDRNGRKGIYMLGAILTLVWGFVMFPLIHVGGVLGVIVACAVGLCLLGMMYGPQAALYTELFSTEVRFSGASLGYQIGAIVGGAFAPSIATYLWAEHSIIWVSVYIAIASLVTLGCVMKLSETYQTDLKEAVPE